MKYKFIPLTSKYYNLIYFLFKMYSQNFFVNPLDTTYYFGPKIVRQLKKLVISRFKIL